MKSAGVKFGDDQILDMAHFDEVGRRIRWSKNELSHSTLELFDGSARHQEQFMDAKITHTGSFTLYGARRW